MTPDKVHPDTEDKVSSWRLARNRNTCGWRFSLVTIWCLHLANVPVLAALRFCVDQGRKYEITDCKSRRASRS